MDAASSDNMASINSSYSSPHLDDETLDADVSPSQAPPHPSQTTPHDCPAVLDKPFSQSKKARRRRRLRGFHHFISRMHPLGFTALPTEIVEIFVKALDPVTKISFALTSRSNYRIAVQATGGKLADPRKGWRRSRNQISGSTALRVLVWAICTAALLYIVLTRAICSLWKEPLLWANMSRTVLRFTYEFLMAFVVWLLMVAAVFSSN